jgi:hypothetical protein
LPPVDTDTTLNTMQHSLGRRGPVGMGRPSRRRLERGATVLIAAAISSFGSISSARGQAPQAPAAPGVPSPYTAPAPTPLETGGLRPPSSPATPPSTAGESETVRQLERAEREDAGRGLEFFWIDVEGGYEYVALQAIRSNGLLDGDRVADSGSCLTLGFGAGVRLIFLTLGGRFRLARQSTWDLYTLDGEVGLHLPMGALEPSFTLAAGYAALDVASVDGVPVFDAERIDVSGLNVRLGANLDFYVNPLLSFGARGTVELLALWRNGSAQPLETPEPAGLAAVNATYARDGDGIGLGLAASATMGLHF